MPHDHKIGFRRLYNQHIAARKFDTPEAVVRWMGALQAQDYGQAVWAIGARSRPATLATIEQAIADAKIIRTWPLRGTIHFVPPENVRWMLNLSASRMLAADAHRMAQLDLTVAIMERCEALFRDELSSGRQLSRPDMMNLLEESGIRTHGQRGYHILWYAAQKGVICLGPMHGKQQTFVLLDEWVPVTYDLSREEALATLAQQYFSSHGPATVYDLAWWAGIPLTDARSGLDAVKQTFTSETFEDTEYWMAEGVSVSTPPSDPAVYLLPGFDEYLLGYKDRSAVLAAEHAQQIVPGNNGIFRPIIVFRGQVVGTWQRRIKRNMVEVTLFPFTTADHWEPQALEAARAYADFVELPLALEVAH